MIALLYALAALGALVVLFFAAVLLLYWNAARRVKKEQEDQIGEFLEENGYGEMGA